MTDVASLLAEAFTEMDADTIDMEPMPATSPAPAAAAAPALSSAAVTTGASVFTANYAPAMLNIIRFLASVHKTSANGGTAAFTTAWSQTPLPTSVAQITSEMQNVYALPVAHLEAVFGALTDEQRRFFHAQCLQLSDGVKSDMPELSLAAALLRWLMQAALPAVQSFPEEGLLNTTAILRKNYTSLDYASRVARPDDSNPEVQKLQNRVLGLERQLAEKERVPAILAKVDSGATSTVATVVPDASACPKSYKQLAIVFGILAGLAFFIVLVLAVLYSKKSNGATTVGAGGAATVSASLGGVRGGKQVLDTGIGGVIEGAGHGIWGFTDLV